MNYELAKKLKDAGFLEHKLDNRRGVRSVYMYPEGWTPTLSELIEAVIQDKPNTFYLEFNDEWSVYEEPNPKGKWKCRYYDTTPVGFYEVFADTPEEAVGNLLLLLLNKKI